MKGQADTQPPTFLKSAGKTQALYNIIQKDVTDAQTGITRTIWEYDYVEVEGELTKSKITAAIQQVKSDVSAVVPDDVAAQYSNAQSELALSVIANKTYAQVDAYIDANVTDMASAKAYLKKLSRVVLALVNSKSI